MRDSAGRESGEPSKAKVFISYSRKDMAFADRLEAALKARGFEPLIDRTEIYAFEEWWKRIEALIARADTVVFVLSPDAVASDVALQGGRVRRLAQQALRARSCAGASTTRRCRRRSRKLNFIFFDDDGAVRGERGSARRGARHRHRLDQAAHRVRRAGAALGAGQAAERIAVALAGAGAGGALDRRRGRAARRRRPRRRRRSSGRADRRRRGGATFSPAVWPPGWCWRSRLAGLAYWQRGVAVEQRAIAQQNEAQAKEERDKRHAQFQAGAEDRREPGVRHRPGAAQRAGHERRDRCARFSRPPRRRSSSLQPSAPDDLGAATKPRGDAERIRRYLSDARRPGAGAQGLPRRPRHRRAPRRRRSAATRSGSAICRSRTTRSATCWWRRASSTRRSRPTATASPSRERLAAADRSNTQWQRDLSVSLRQASATCWWRRASSRRRSRPTATASPSASGSPPPIPATRGWQRDLSVSYNKIGDVLVAQGKLDEALKAYRDGLAIAERLAAADRSNTQWQRDLSVSYNKIGDVLVAQGKLDEALKAYRDGLAIRERLAAADPQQHAVAARSVGVVRQGRRRAGGAGQARRGAQGLPRQPRHRGAARRRRSQQYAVAARSVGRRTARSATC